MRKLLFLASLLITCFSQLAIAQSINDSDRRQIERELERQIANDTNENIRVRLNSADTYYISNRETGVRGQATVEGRRSGSSGRNDIWYDVTLDTRRNNITRATWSYGRNPGGYDRDRNDNQTSGALRSGRYEIQLVATKRLLVADNNGQVVQSNSGNARSRQWEIEQAGNGYYYIRSVDTGEVMTVEGNGDSGSGIVLMPQGRNRDAQLWDIRTGPDNGYYFLAPTGRSMDSPSSARYDGGRMQVYKRNGEANQRFWLRWIGDIRRGDNWDRGGNRGERWQDRGRDRDNWDRPSRNGSLRWRGRVDDVVEIEIRGDQLYERVVSGQQVSDVSSRFNSNLPRRRVNVNVEKLRGRGYVEVVEQPSSRNNFTAIVRIRDTKGGADDYEIEVYWE
ncbi:MAG TPA: RICIN domain-containing protein [Blastocatellia bacterium]|nr:RICIN domain-containing protein [Blastocatellia bacterium]